MERSPKWLSPPPPPNLVKYFFNHTRKFTKGTVVATALLVSCGGGGGGGGGAAGGQAYSPLSCTVDWACPAGFIPVCGNPVLGTSDFCVMKFEAKNASGVATSQAAGTSWQLGPANAYSACNSLTATNFDGDFALISNREWMTVARAVEAVASNWSGGVVGSGHLARGHSDGLPLSYLAVTSEDDPWNGTGGRTEPRRAVLVGSREEPTPSLAGAWSGIWPAMIRNGSIGMPRTAPILTVPPPDSRMAQRSSLLPWREDSPPMMSCRPAPTPLPTRLAHGITTPAMVVSPPLGGVYSTQTQGEVSFVLT